MSTYEVQIGRGEKGSYKTRYDFTSRAQALLYYSSINIGGGHKKRLLLDGKVILRSGVQR